MTEEKPETAWLSVEDNESYQKLVILKLRVISRRLLKALEELVLVIEFADEPGAVDLSQAREAIAKAREPGNLPTDQML